MNDVLHLTEIEKRYGNVRALDKAELRLRAGEVHVLLGANGSGKSTLSKIIVGVVRPDRGGMALDGRPFAPHGPDAARREGIAEVYQEMSLVPTLTVAENITLGSSEDRPSLLVDQNRMHESAQRALDSFAGVFDTERCRPDATAGSLPPDEQQIVEILKALHRKPRILILDEATASLRGRQVERLFTVVEELKRTGCAVVFISHRMEEIFRIGDRATVLRNGRTVGSFVLAESNREELLAAMVGEAVEERERSPDVGGSNAEPLLSATDLRCAGVRGVSFTLRRGEVLGLSGLQGQGQSELLRALFGAEGAVDGEIELDGDTVRIAHPADAVRRGIAFVTGDRKRFGIFPTRAILENLAVVGIRTRRSAIFSRRSVARWVQPVVGRLEIVFSRLAARIVSLSGGNQQKVIIGRWLLTAPRVLLMDDPTKGVDIKTKNELYDVVAQMCAEGVSVIWSSSEDRELLDAAHRVLVMREGRVAAELQGEKLNAYELYNAAL